MKNMTAKPKMSLAQRASVDESWVMVLLKLMYLNICKGHGETSEREREGKKHGTLQGPLEAPGGTKSDKKNETHMEEGT